MTDTSVYTNDVARLCEFESGPAGWLELTIGSLTKVVRQGKCGRPAETLDYPNGARCAAHPPRWNAEYAAGCRDAGRDAVADEYLRTHMALLRQRIAGRPGPSEREAA